MKQNILISSSLLVLNATILFAQPGSLDNTFGTGGKITTSIGSPNDAGHAITVQADGKILVAGMAGNTSGNYDFALIRYNIDGTLDNTFGSNGKATTDFYGHNVYSGYSVLIQSDGKIVMAGNSNDGIKDSFALVRYNANGTVDNTFGKNGKVSTAIGDSSDGIAYSLLQIDGKIIVAGTSKSKHSASKIALARYNTDGSLDNSFGTGGKVTTVVGSIDDRGNAASIQSDGKILVEGSSMFMKGYNNYATIRYNIDGTLDNTFGSNGKVITNFGNTDASGFSLAIQKDGKMVVGGYSINTLVRYNMDGSLDNSFGSGGKALGILNFIISAISIQVDGKLLATGFIFNGTTDNFAIVRYKSNGTLDSTFGTAGQVTTSFGSSAAEGYAMAIQPDLKIVVAGSSSGNGFAVARYISGLHIGLVDFSLTNAAPLIYPNPIGKQAELEYTLIKDETLSISLYDLTGKQVQTFFTNGNRQQGSHKETLIIPEALPAGNYILMLSNGNKNQSIKLTHIKN